MAKVVCSVFEDSKQAGDAVADLKGKGFSESISVVSKDEDTGKTNVTNVDQNVKDGALAGAATGAVVGGVAAILAGAASFVIPGAGLMVLGPLATALSGAAVGAATGGLVGVLVDKGIPEDQAKWYEEAVKRGEVFVSVAVDDDQEETVMEILDSHGGMVAEVDEV